jgi:hypothetical protein
MDRLVALFAEWNEDPPTHLLVAAFLGLERKTPPVVGQGTTPAAKQSNNVDTLKSMFPGGVIGNA